MHQLAALWFLAGPALSQGTVWTVAPDGSGDFTDIPTAVAAAADGDTVLVQGGSYFTTTSIDVDGKGLSLIAEPEASVMVFTFGGPNPPAIRVRNLAPEQSVTVRGFALQSLYDDPSDQLLLENDVGPVHVEDVTSGAMGPGLTAIGCESLTVVRSLLAGGNGGVHSFIAGAVVTDSNAYFYDTEILGADGPLEDCSVFSCTPAGWGGTGLEVNGASEVLLAGCTVSGGNAGCAPEVGAGTGLDVDSGAVVRNRGSSIAGGEGGSASCTTPGTPADAVGGAGATLELEGGPRSFGLSPPSVESEGEMEFSYEGEKGDFVFLLYRLAEPANAAVWFDPLFALHLELPGLGILPRGTLPPSGTLVDPIGLPVLAFSVSLQAQALFSTAEGPWVTSGPSSALFHLP